MSKQRLAKGARKYVRRQKALIRRNVLDLAEQKKLIEELYKKTKHFK